MNINDKIKKIINEIEKEVGTEKIKNTESYQIGVIEGLEWALEILEQEDIKIIKGETA